MDQPELVDAAYSIEDIEGALMTYLDSRGGAEPKREPVTV